MDSPTGPHGRGRRPIADGRLLVNLGVRALPEALATLDLRSAETGRPKARILGEIVEEWYRREVAR